MRIAQISDTHISCEHPSRADDLADSIRQINALSPRPSIVVHTGDVVHNGLPEEYEIAKSLLNKLLVPYFVLPGNKDKRETLIEFFADGTRIVPGMGFIQYSVEEFDVRLIFIDTIEEGCNKGRLCEARLRQIDEMLAADRGRLVALFLHHPPFAASVAPDPVQFEDWSDVERLQVCLSRHDHIRSMFCGHVHRRMTSSVGKVGASVATSIAADLRWDRPAEPGGYSPIFDLHNV